MNVVEVFSPNLQNWNEIRERIFLLEKQAFAALAFTSEEISSDFTNPNNTVILLKNDKSEIIGFIYAKPVEEAEPERVSEKGETAYIWDTVIEKEYRGRKLVGMLTGKLEEELGRKGYKYMERCAVVANNYANNVLKNYQDRIVKQEPIDSMYGPQIYLRIRL